MNSSPNQLSPTLESVAKDLDSIKNELAALKRTLEYGQLKSKHADESRYSNDERRIRREEIGQAVLTVLLVSLFGLAGVWLSIEEPTRTAVVGLVVIVSGGISAIKILLHWIDGADGS